MPSSIIENVLEKIPTLFMYLLFAVIVIGLLIRFFKDYLGKSRKVKATVIDKSTSSSKIVSRFGGEKVIKKFIVVFEGDGKILRFFASGWVYDSVNLNEKGILIYRGNRFIRFDS